MHSKTQHIQLQKIIIVCIIQTQQRLKNLHSNSLSTTQMHNLVNKIGIINQNH